MIYHTQDELEIYIPYRRKSNTLLGILGRVVCRSNFNSLKLNKAVECLVEYMYGNILNGGGNKCQFQFPH
jgi:hypothetical protein